MFHSVQKMKSINRKSGKFDVMIVATMSAGKTSLVNALIGREILYSANEAATACLTSIEYKKSAIKFRGRCYSEKSELVRLNNVSLGHVREWNANPEIKYIRLSGRFNSHHRPVPGLTLHDTPGPNNSQSDRHVLLMKEAVRTIPFKILCYVLNAGQLGTRDDHELLSFLRENILGLTKPIFVLNKVDLLDPEQGESIEECLKNARSYLESIGFERPIIVPAMANVALYARKELNLEPLTKSQRLKLEQSLRDIHIFERDCLYASSVPEVVNQELRRSVRSLRRVKKNSHECVVDDYVTKLKKLVACSGIWAVETLIKQQYKMVA